MELLTQQVNYIGASALFVIGLYMVIARDNLVQKIIGINIMETSVFLVFVAIGFVYGGAAPIVGSSDTQGLYVNPLPSALILTGIVVAVSITVFALSIIIGIYRSYGTIELSEIRAIRSEKASDR